MESINQSTNWTNTKLITIKEGKPIMVFPGKLAMQKQDEIVRLKSDNHCQKLLSGAFKEENCADMTLITEGKRIKAHKSILRQGSRYFENNLEENGPENGAYEIKLNNICFSDLSKLIAYMYCGIISVKSSELERLTKAAEFLGIDLQNPKQPNGNIVCTENEDFLNRENLLKRESHSRSEDVKKIEKLENEKNFGKGSCKTEKKSSKKTVVKIMCSKVRNGVEAILLLVY